ncbi:uncharacterized protein LOC123317036 [Coccinella septempunctata]|uniref:uncharacterized protein LOC123317036 n=1 Tax=Coccinella septempunctata TaxID=41139 RepID=UPI001D074CB2|nr:uncharacterized protein LOC123317036 [Coccinella septempunctata]
MSGRENAEFKNALRDIATHAHFLSSPFDRVRCAEWVRKLISLPDDNLDTAKIRNEYAQLLRIQVRNRLIHGPFASPPPDSNVGLCSLPEALGSMIGQQIPFLPRTGRIQPVLHHKSPDGRAYISAKQIPGGGVFVYMAVSPDGLE